MSKKLIIWYKRVSHSQQVGEGKHGLQRQQDYFDEYLKGLPDVEQYTVETISDEGKSAFHGVNVSEAGGLGGLLARIQRGEIPKGSILVCEEQSRLTRLGHMEAMLLIHSITTAGIKIWALADNREINSQDFGDAMVMLVNAFRNNEYSLNLSKKVGKAKRDIAHKVRVERSGLLGAVHPYWLRLNAAGDGFEPIGKHVETIQRIFRERCQLKSMASIAAGLNADGVPLITVREWKKKAPPVGWSLSTIKNILKNKRVIGYLPQSQRKGAMNPEVAGYYGEPIVPLEQWNAVQDMMIGQTGKKTVRDESNPYGVRLFKSLLVCRFCGHRMDVNGARGRLSARGTPFLGSLTCRSSREDGCMNGVNKTRTPTMPMRLVEDALTGKLFRDLKLVDVTSGIVERVALLRVEIRDIETAIEEATASLGSLKSTRARTAIIQHVDGLGEEFDKKTSELAAEERKQQATSMETLEGLDLSTVDGRIEAQRVIAKVIRSIVVDTVTRVADIELMNGNVIRGFSLDSGAVDNTLKMKRAVDGDEYTREVDAIVGGAADKWVFVSDK